MADIIQIVFEICEQSNIVYNVASSQVYTLHTLFFMFSSYVECEFYCISCHIFARKVWYYKFQRQYLVAEKQPNGKNELEKPPKGPLFTTKVYKS